MSEVPASQQCYTFFHEVLRGWVAVQAATGEDVTAEELGGAELHCTTSGRS